MYKSFTSNTTGEFGAIFGLPGADAKPFGNAKLPGMYNLRNPPDLILSIPSSKPAITVADSGSPVNLISFGLPFSTELSNIKPFSFMAT